jgi:hypothetical protein
MTELKIPVSVGELIDKLSILQIKIEKIIDDNKLSHVQTEYKKLKEASEIYLNQKSINSLFNKLLDVNRILWNIEDLIREKDKKNEFDEEFIEIAKKVYKNNDIRFCLKNEINQITNSEIKEQKNY